MRGVKAQAIGAAPIPLLSVVTATISAIPVATALVVTVMANAVAF